MFTTQFNHETLRHRAASAPREGREHLVELRTGDPPPPGRRRMRRPIALLLARAARRIDREAARRAIA